MKISIGRAMAWELELNNPNVKLVMVIAQSARNLAGMFDLQRKVPKIDRCELGS